MIVLINKYIKRLKLGSQKSGIMRNRDRLLNRPAPIELEYGFDCVSLCKKRAVINKLRLPTRAEIANFLGKL